MKSFVALTSIVLAAVGIAASPVKRQSRAFDDTAILNFALTLEHLESAFYTQGLAKFDQAAFVNAGYPSFARGRFQQIGDHEKAHVDFLAKALGDKATKPCEYNFPYHDVQGFVALSQALEGVGVTAYSGAAQLITNKDYLTAAAVVLSTEARHAAWIGSAVNKVAPWSGALDVPLTPNEVFTLASAFIKACPSTNPSLPVKAYPALTISPGAGAAKVTPGKSALISFTTNQGQNITPGTKLYAAFFTGLDRVFAPLTASKDGKGWTAVVPDTLRGTVYTVISTSGTSAIDGQDVVAGPGILDFETDSNGNLI